MTKQSLFPHVMAEFPAIWRPSLEHNANDSKSSFLGAPLKWLPFQDHFSSITIWLEQLCVLGDLTNDHAVSFLISRTSGLPFQDHLLSITPQIQRAVSCENHTMTVQRLSHQWHHSVACNSQPISNYGSTNLKGSASGKSSMMTVQCFTPVSSPSCLPFKDHLQNITPSVWLENLATYSGRSQPSPNSLDVITS